MIIKTNRTGEVGYNNQGLKMQIKEYRSSYDMDIEFEDGYIAYNKQYHNFKNGKIHNKNIKDARIIDRTGEINYNSCGSKMKIIVYNKKNDIIVEFENGYKVKSIYKDFKKGFIKNPYDKTVFGIGYVGEGKYGTCYNKGKPASYKIWINMMRRCYDKKHHKKSPTYIDVKCCSDWHNFQNFAQWYDEHYYEIVGQRMELDKDILHKGNKLYSPDNCIFVPHRINVLFVKNNAVRGQYSIGVTWNKTTCVYQSNCSTYDNNQLKQIHLGNFNTEREAFESYKKFKECYIKKVANEYKELIPIRLYKAMYDYIV